MAPERFEKWELTHTVAHKGHLFIYKLIYIFSYLFLLRNKCFLRGKKSLLRGENFSLRKYVCHWGKNLYSEEKTFFCGKKSLYSEEKTFFHGNMFSTTCDREPRYQCIFVTVFLASSSIQRRAALQQRPLYWQGYM